MKELIKALQILSKYVEGYNKDYPTNCEHEELQVIVNPKKVSNDDKEKLYKLGFLPQDDYFVSYKYGSC
jgi:hypothetical protein